MVLDAAGKAKDIDGTSYPRCHEAQRPGRRTFCKTCLTVCRRCGDMRHLRSCRVRNAGARWKALIPGRNGKMKAVLEKEIRLRTDLDETFRVGPASIRLHAIPRKKEPEIPKNQYTKWFDYDKINHWIIHKIQEKWGLSHAFRRWEKEAPQIHDR